MTDPYLTGGRVTGWHVVNRFGRPVSRTTIDHADAEWWAQRMNAPALVGEGPYRVAEVTP